MHPSTPSRSSSIRDPSRKILQSAGTDDPCSTKKRLLSTEEQEAPDTADNNTLSTVEDVAPPAGLLLQGLTESETIEAVQPVIPYVDVKVGKSALEVVIRRATLIADVTLQEDFRSGSEAEEESTDSVRPTNVFSRSSHDSRLFGVEESVADGRSALNFDAKLPLIVGQEPFGKLVRCLSIRRSMSAIETTQVQNPSRQKSQLESQRARSYRDIRRAFEEHREFVPKQAKEHESRSTRLTESCGSSDEAADRSIKRRFSQISRPNFEMFRDKFGKHVDGRKRSKVNVSKISSYDGSHSPGLSQGSTASGSVPDVNTGIGALNKTKKIPDDVDNRQGYGRRVRNVTVRIPREAYTDYAYKHLDDPRLRLPRRTYQT